MVDPKMPDYDQKYFEPESEKFLAPYVKRLIAEGMPMWMVDIERRDFRTAHDTGANLNALYVWNSVRKAHGFSRLTIDDLWDRHAEDGNWSPEKLQYEKIAWKHYKKFGTFPKVEEVMKNGI